MVQQWLEKFTIMEDCEYTLVSALYGQFAVYGTLPALPFDIPAEGQVRTMEIGGVPVDVLRLTRVTGASLQLLCRRDESERMLEGLSSLGLPQIAEEDFHRWRVRNLVPAVGNELGELSNPLEAGAGAVVDFHKGCYIGQEVIARLDSYDKVQRQLVRLRWHLALPTDSLPGRQLLFDARDAGFITTQVPETDGATQVGIGCVRKTWATPGTVLHCLVDGEAVNITVE
jgi:folate-binding protein YgfZ